MTKTITFTDLRGQSQSVSEEKAMQLLSYLSKQITECHATIAACKQIRDAKGAAEYDAKAAAMTKVSDQITVAVLED